jgi:hypothetical protein
LCVREVTRSAVRYTHLQTAIVSAVLKFDTANSMK